jgi:predicted  nucleic acid-binding Zn-ribbon protein
MINLANARATPEAFLLQGTSLSEKMTAAQSEEASLTQQHERAAKNLDEIERKHILDQATDQELFEAQQAHSDLAAKLVAVNRRIQLIREAIADNDSKIAAVTQAFKKAQMAFCFESRDAALAKIRENQQLRKLILEAMAAHASNGMIAYSYRTRTFIEEFFHQTFPAISEQEVREAAGEFKTKNSLD